MPDATEEAPRVRLDFDSYSTELVLPVGTEILRTREPEPVADVLQALDRAFSSPVGCPPFAALCHEALKRMTSANPSLPRSVVVVVSDHSRPVPYKGDAGILWPLVSFLLEAGFPSDWITLLVATGTHHVLTDSQMWALFDPRIREAGVRVSCHDAACAAGLVPVDRSDPAARPPAGRTDPDGHAPAGRPPDDPQVSINRVYAEAGFRILTGLVEPHFMAGASGGRKSICPGLLDVRSVRDFHGPAVVASDGIGDLRLEGNPCHQYSLEIASLLPPDFILNVTMRPDGRVAGVFAGDMQAAHLAAVEHLRSFSEVRLDHEYDIVVTHAARVGINHYQASKAIGSAAPAVRQGGCLIVVADTTDSDPVGSESYRRLLGLLAESGAEAFQALLRADDWEFAQDQWAVQSLALILEKIPRENLYYFSPQTPAADYAILPCRRPVDFAESSGMEEMGETEEIGETVTRFVRAAVERATQESRVLLGREPRIAFLADGPHCVPRLPGAPLADFAG